MKNGSQPLEHPELDETATQDSNLKSSEPSWFLQSGIGESRDDLMVRYRASRNLSDPALPPRPPSSLAARAYREQIMTRPHPPQRFLSGIANENIGEEATNKPKPPQWGLRKTFFAAAMLASAAGAAVGFLSSQFHDIDDTAASLINEIATEPRVQVPAQKPAAAQAAQATSILKKPIATATLEVSDISGETNTPIALDLRAEPAVRGQDLLLKISGLPDQAFLTTGRRQSDKIWALTLADLENAKLMIPQSQQSAIDVTVAAFEPKSGELAAPVKAMHISLTDVAIEPASAAPPSQFSRNVMPAAAQLSAIPHPEGKSLTRSAVDQVAGGHVARAETLLKSGDMDAARTEYEQAWTAGAIEGAMGVARSYDPVILASLKFTGVKPDSAKAIQWYERAAIAGNTDAINAIVRLRLKPD